MASFSSYSSSSSFRTLIFIALILINTWSSCIGRAILIVKESDHSSLASNYFQEKAKRRSEELYFAKLPKGVPIPPSGPSKNHNSLPQD